MTIWGVLLIAVPSWFAVTVLLAIVIGRAVRRADTEELTARELPAETSSTGLGLIAS